MITIPKFRDAVTTHFRRSRVAAYTALLVGVTIGLLGQFAIRDLPQGGAWSAWVAMAPTVWLVMTLLAVGIIGVWHNERRSRDDPCLICPHCERPLQLHSGIVIATRNCPRCGQRVLAG